MRRGKGRRATASAVARAVGARAEKWRAVLRLLPHAGRGIVVASVLANTAIGLLPLGFVVAMSVLIGRIPGAAAPGAGWPPLVAALLVACGTFAVQQCLVPFQTALGEIAARRVDGYCIHRLMSAALRDAPLSALDRPDMLDILADSRAALDRAMPTPGEAIAGVLALVARYGQLVGAVLLAAVTLSPVAGGVLAMTALVTRFGQRGSLGRFAKVWQGLAGRRRAMTYVRTYASSESAAKDIRVLGLVEWLRARERSEARAYLGSLWAGRRRILLRPFIGFAALGMLGGCASLVLLARSAAAGELSVLELAVAIQTITIPIRFGVFFPESDAQTQYGLQGYHALSRFEESAAQMRPGSAGGTIAGAGPVARGVSFQDVRFGYGPDAPEVLRGLDLGLPAGTSTAIVGLSGGGKTTLVKLLARFYDPSSGRITVDDRPLTELDPREWQSRLSVIFQDFVRYELSAAANIALGAPRWADDTDGIREAAERAGVLDALERLPDGLSTVLSRGYRGGRDLSGGQWQRVALARALFAVRHGASLLVLDEPTAQLDARAEVEFFDRFLETVKGVTSVIISHRFSTVRKADQILVLEDGRIVERGSHQELMAARGSYERLFRLQARRFAAHDVDGRTAP
ncbi:ABC transporter ATP-binding protein/permease [Streptomyces sp. NBC_01166]|uniref:ABC transporter ATP-binding protein n=1 Tax=Streptomyces sp. NBC_01166 TaxID=2903755 RepID=UPI0038684D41|nr:ABC transporter ATP-binding protein/permease [Streptomyces sp. NBC_01166]